MKSVNVWIARERFSSEYPIRNCVSFVFVLSLSLFLKWKQKRVFIFQLDNLTLNKYAFPKRFVNVFFMLVGLWMSSLGVYKLINCE